MASGRLGKCDLQSCCGAQIYQNLDANECPVSLTYHAQALSTTTNVKLTTFVGIASTTLFATTDTWTWGHSNVSMQCSFGGWISCMPLKYECRELTCTDSLDNYWGKCGVVRSNTGFAITQTSCYYGSAYGSHQCLPSTGANAQPGVGTAVYDAGAIGARFVHPVEYVSGLGTTTRGQQYYSNLCTCIGHFCPDCITYSMGGQLKQSVSGYPYGYSCDASGVGWMCRCCVPVPYGGSEIVNPGIALTHMYPFKGCQTPDGNMAMTKILGWVPGTLGSEPCWGNCCTMRGVRIITEAHTGCNMENAMQMLVNPCMCCGQVVFDGCGCSNGCRCPGGSHYWKQFCMSASRDFNQSCRQGETYDLIDWYALTCGNFFCNCCRCCPVENHRSLCQDNGELRWWSNSNSKYFCCQIDVCGYACAMKVPLGHNCAAETIMPFFKIYCNTWFFFSPKICICCQSFCCGQLKTECTSDNGKEYMCCCCGSPCYYTSRSMGGQQAFCSTMGYQPYCATGSGCNICVWSVCNCNSGPWTGTICEQGNISSRLTHGGGYNYKEYVMSPYGVKQAASMGIGMINSSCGNCQNYWIGWMSHVCMYWNQGCPSENCRLNHFYIPVDNVEHVNGTAGVAYLHDTAAAYGELSQCTGTYCVGYQEYALKYFAYNPEKDCHYFMMRSNCTSHCGIWSMNWRLFRLMKHRKCCCPQTSTSYVRICKSLIPKGLDGFAPTFVGLASRTGCNIACAFCLQDADTSDYYCNYGNSTGDGPGSCNTTGGGTPALEGPLGITSVVMMKQADFPALMTARKYTTPRMCVSCLFRADYSLWSLSLYNCATCGWDAFLSPDLVKWSSSNFHTGVLADTCKVTCFSTDCGCMYTVCDCFMANVECAGVLDYCYEFNNYERTGVVLSYGDRIYVKNHSTTPFSFQVWGYEG